MFSVHVDTARTWRGGQNQVLLTVRGLRAGGHRTGLVAHPLGALRRRMPMNPTSFRWRRAPSSTSARPGGSPACCGGSVRRSPTPTMRTRSR